MNDKKSSLNVKILDKNIINLEEENTLDSIDYKNNELSSKESLKNDRLKTNVNKNRSVKDSMNLIGDIPVKISVELGNTKITIKEFLKLSEGSIFYLDKKVENSLNIFVNDYLIAEGEIVMIENQYGIRITKIVGSIERMRHIS